MYMKNLIFKNNDVEEEFYKLCDSHLLIIIGDFIQDYQKSVVTKVYFEGYKLNVLLEADDELITISFNYRELLTYISSDKKDYEVIYDNHPHQFFTIKGYRYQKDNKVLLKENIINTDFKKKEKNYSYTFYINNHCYTINIVDYEDSFNEKIFLQYILNKSLLDISNINEMYVLMVNSNDIHGLKLEIIDKLNNDILLSNRGNLEKYRISYQEDEVAKEVFLKDNKFYEKETVVKELNENNVLIKKIGGRYGKR